MSRERNHGAVHRASVRDRAAEQAEAERVARDVDHALATAGLPDHWVRVLRAGAPAALRVVGLVATALHPESPGGTRPTRAELQAIVRAVGQELEVILAAELGLVRLGEWPTSDGRAQRYAVEVPDADQFAAELASRLTPSATPPGMVELNPPAGGGGGAGKVFMAAADVAEMAAAIASVSPLPGAPGALLADPATVIHIDEDGREIPPDDPTDETPVDPETVTTGTVEELVHAIGQEWADIGDGLADRPNPFRTVVADLAPLYTDAPAEAQLSAETPPPVLPPVPEGRDLQPGEVIEPAVEVIALDPAAGNTGTFEPAAVDAPDLDDLDGGVYRGPRPAPPATEG